MSTEIKILLRATDEATSVLKNASSNLKSSLDDVGSAGRRVKESSDHVTASSKEVALAFNNVATSGFALYNAVDRVMDMQVAVDRANLQVKTSLNAVEDAQRRYNTTVEKYGPASEQAQAAAKDLQLAQERYQVATERADMMQGNLNEAMVMSAMTVIPSLITMITSVSTLTTSWTAVTKAASTALTFLSANPIVLVIAGIAALASALVLAYEKCEWFRNGINAIGSAVYDFFVPPVKAATKSVEELTAALKTGTGYSQGFAEAERQSVIITQQLKEAAEKAAAETSKLTSELEVSWKKQRAAADEQLGAIKARFDSAFNAGDFNTAVGIVRDFANKYGLALSDAEKIIDSFTAKVAEVPKTFEEQLIAKAQADLQVFKDCATGKFAGIADDSGASMQNLVRDTNDLIARGLVGQAQDNIQAFVNCATDKQSKMVSDIDGYLEELYKNYDENTEKINQLLKWRLSLTWGEPGSDILAAIRLAGGGTAAAEAAAAEPTLSYPSELAAAKQLQYEIFMQREGFQEGGIVRRPTLVWVGEAGPEAIIPLNRARVGGDIYVNIAVEGSMDKRVADYVIDKLKNVLVEPSSSGAGSTHKKIRIGTVLP